jgi:RNA polymerase sigma-70 factor, ECF subfamily
VTDDDYDEFFRTSYPRLVAMGMATSVDRSIAQDLAQETLLRAYNHRDRLASYDSPLAWCRRVMGNLLIDHHRTRSSEIAAVERLGSRAESAADGIRDEVADLAVGERWADLTASLTAQQRLVATLYYAEDQSVADVAEIMNVATGTVKSALSKARSTLRRRLEATLPDAAARYKGAES